MVIAFLICSFGFLNFSAASEGGGRKFILTDSITSSYRQGASPPSDMVREGEITFLRDDQDHIQFYNVVVNMEKGDRQLSAENRHSGLWLMVRAQDNLALYAFTDPHIRNNQTIWRLLKKYDELFIPKLEGKKISFKLTGQWISILDREYPFAQIQWD